MELTDKITPPLEWRGDYLRILDQTQLPGREVYLDLRDYREVAVAIKELKVRGAPAIGAAGAYGIAVGALNLKAKSVTAFRSELAKVISAIAGTRPTARNLFHAVERMEKASRHGNSIEEIQKALVREAQAVENAEADATTKISKYGAALVPDKAVIITHCNAGPLATCGIGTALGVIIEAHRQGKQVRVFSDETRPLLQGARLTTWELMRAGVPVTLITDNMSAYVMKEVGVDMVVVGADRIAANGDTANKIGTYGLAILAHEHKVPFYIAAPVSTVDMAIKTGADIPIEQRNVSEVTSLQGVRTAPVGCEALNPAFDVTPHKYIIGIITDKGVIRKPYGVGLRGMYK